MCLPVLTLFIVARIGNLHKVQSYQAIRKYEILLVGTMGWICRMSCYVKEAKHGKANATRPYSYVESRKAGIIRN